MATEDAEWDEVLRSFAGMKAAATEKKEEDRCVHCGSDDVTLDDSIYICARCRTVQERFIDPGAEWRFFSDSRQKDPSRCGMPINDLMPEASMSTFIGMPTSSKNYREMAQISRYQMWHAMPYRERSLFHAIDHLTVRAVNGGVTQSIIDEAKVLFKRITEMRLSRGENRIGLLASSIYVACKNNGVPRSAKEIAAMFSIDTAVITRNCKRFQEAMHLRLPASSPGDYVMRFCSQLQLPPELQTQCAALVAEVERSGTLGHCSPPSIVAGCIYVLAQAAGLRLSKREVSEVCGVSEVTINKCQKQLLCTFS